MKIQIFRTIETVTVVVLILLSNLTFAQPEKQASKREQIKAQKIAFITDKVNLTPEEAEVFWPVYNEFESHREEVQKSFAESGRFESINVDQLTDEEATKVANDQIIMAQKMLDLRKEYYVRYKGILPIKKVLKLYQAEKEFQRVLLERIRQQGPPKKRY